MRAGYHTPPTGCPWTARRTRSRRSTGSVRGPVAHRRAWILARSGVGRRAKRWTARPAGWQGRQSRRPGATWRAGGHRLREQAKIRSPCVRSPRQSRCPPPGRRRLARPCLGPGPTTPGPPRSCSGSWPGHRDAVPPLGRRTAPPALDAVDLGRSLVGHRRHPPRFELQRHQPAHGLSRQRLHGHVPAAAGCRGATYALFAPPVPRHLASWYLPASSLGPSVST